MKITDNIENSRLLADLKGLGKLKDFSSEREDRPNQIASDDGAPARVDLILTSPERIVSEETGLGFTLRKMLSRSLEGLMKSLVNLVAGAALIGPWIAAVAFIIWLFVRIRRKRQATS